MRVIGVQLDIAWEDKDANFERVRRLVAAGFSAPAPAPGRGSRGGGLIVLPEMFATGFSMDVPAVAETTARETERFLRELAVATGCAVLGGLVTRQADGRGLNEAVAVSPGGEELARYAKLHPFSFAGEDRHYAAGDRVVTFHWGGFTVAPFICYDLRFPEAYREAVRQGAEVLVTIANFPAARQHHWTALNIARAIENQAYVVAVNRCGDDPKARYAGGSLVIGPRGETLAEGGAAEGLVMAELDRVTLEGYRTEFPALADVRADLLGTARGPNPAVPACPV